MPVLRTTVQGLTCTGLTRARVRGLVRSLGWEIHRVDPDESLDGFLGTLLPALGVNCVLDVGARIGAFGDMLRRRGYRGRIASFEPVRTNLRWLELRARRDPLWDIYPLALGSQAATAAINVAGNTEFSSFLCPNQAAAELTSSSGVDYREVVPVRRLDDLFDEITRGIREPRVFLKMDTQGWDLEVLRGAAGCLDAVVALQSEMSVRPLYNGMPSFQEALDELSRAGFAITAMFKVTRDDLLRLVEFDCVMVRDRPA